MRIIKIFLVSMFLLSASIVWAQNSVETEGPQGLAEPNPPIIEEYPTQPASPTMEEYSTQTADPVMQPAPVGGEEVPVEAVVDPRPVVAIPDPQENQSTYTLGKEDVIQIVVMRHPEVSGSYIINAEGKIQYEFVGDVVVEGMTKEQVKDHVTKLLSTYIVTPEVTVKIVGYNSKVIYVVGEVGAPGKIFMRGDTITVREALMQAGLPLLTASNKKSRVITPSEAGDALQRDVNVDALLYEGDLRENLVMKPGDTLYIPPTFLAKTMRVINPIAQPIGTAAGTGRTVTTGF